MGSKMKGKSSLTGYEFFKRPAGEKGQHPPERQPDSVWLRDAGRPEKKIIVINGMEVR